MIFSFQLEVNVCIVNRFTNEPKSIWIWQTGVHNENIEHEDESEDDDIQLSDNQKNRLDYILKQAENFSEFVNSSSQEKNNNGKRKAALPIGDKNNQKLVLWLSFAVEKIFNKNWNWFWTCYVSLCRLENSRQTMERCLQEQIIAFNSIKRPNILMVKCVTTNCEDWIGWLASMRATWMAFWAMKWVWVSWKTLIEFIIFLII